MTTWEGSHHYSGVTAESSPQIGTRPCVIGFLFISLFGQNMLKLNMNIKQTLIINPYYAGNLYQAKIAMAHHVTDCFC